MNGKVAVITGAASGIGRGTALCLAKEGAAVVAVDLNSRGGEQVVSEIAAAGGRAVFQHTDVSKRAFPRPSSDAWFRSRGLGLSQPRSAYLDQSGA